MQHNPLRPSKIKFYALLTTLMMIAILLASCAEAQTSTSQTPTQASPETTQMHTPDTAEATSEIDPLSFRQAVRKLWEDHVIWTRVYIISALAGLPEADAAAERLLQNQVDIGNAIKPFYGDQAGEQLSALLKEHILTAVDLLDAAKSGDDAGFEAANKSWYDNADQIAGLLNSANPEGWPLSDMQSMMKSHLDLTLEEATARLNEDWAADVAAYDKVNEDILRMADMLAAGIVQQFPDRFAPLQAAQPEIDLTLAMDKLWEDHVTWTRMYIISATSSLPDADAAAERLLKNQEDIGAAIQPLYGEEAGNRLTALLKDHITTAVDLLAAAKSGEDARLEDASTRWYENADEIAGFLSSANPDNWPLSDMQAMMKSHLDLTLDEATARLEGGWEADVMAYDKVHDDILAMSGMLTKGIIAQFPDQFK